MLSDDESFFCRPRRSIRVANMKIGHYIGPPPHLYRSRVGIHESDPTFWIDFRRMAKLANR